MRITIEKGLPFLKVKEAMEIILSENDVLMEDLEGAYIQRDVVIKVINDDVEDWRYEYVNSKEIVISAEYIKEIEACRLTNDELERKEIVFPREWNRLDFEIMQNIIKCEAALHKVEKQIQNAEKMGRKKETIKKYEQDKAEFERELKLLNKWRKIYIELNKQYVQKAVDYGYMNLNHEKVYAMKFVYNKKVYVFTEVHDYYGYGPYALFEIEESKIVEKLQLGGLYYNY